ncbi:hydroxyethylthiazole kinase [Rhodococcus rhodochrous J3]|uniref:Hydroxyethylthiazole kinase n=2 Tax=Rhodococcus rhodochrous TaxID=1829 RepID=A0AA46WWV9_RHORH|nr:MULTISPECIES: hydroxyethylthiazole kinase [Rhodococcus]AYA24804.1 hydroxyethylthiazole kinase [Rhodococcus rhodochrous]MBF4481290.1 hydroxyethylthiazole kinase [Rhodococcus rhodochrous]MCB8911167.1 hydroxyethylthiazole kinase [Rhodococcus rhodochrous]MCD2098935.1 hydroxyethylthiazole kinase [Rhodococcus rhodochrous]MCD2123479.1 hydroxyethylthiazole kinase [Rhodococcus rhodochrous]
MTTTPTVDDLAVTLDALRAQTPLVHSLTNIVSANFLTNVLLAAGASNAHIDNAHEAGDFARIAGGVLVNLGTPFDETSVAFALAAEAAHDAGTPWVLDPVGVGGLAWRTSLAADLLKFRPTAIRGNASEIIALAGLGGDTRGVDSADEAAAAVPAALALLDRADAVSASGPVDYLVGRDRDGGIVGLRIAGGSAMLPRVTSTGCSLGGLVAAYLAVAETPLVGLAAAHTHVAVASEIAEENSTGPGSFAVAYLDALFAVDADTLRARARVEPFELPSKDTK